MYGLDQEEQFSHTHKGQFAWLNVSVAAGIIQEGTQSQQNAER